jgi:hypothetical protein
VVILFWSDGGSAYLHLCYANIHYWPSLFEFSFANLITPTPDVIPSSAISGLVIVVDGYTSSDDGVWLLVVDLGGRFCKCSVLHGDEGTEGGCEIEGTVDTIYIDEIHLQFLSTQHANVFKSMWWAHRDKRLGRIYLLRS